VRLGRVALADAMAGGNNMHCVHVQADMRSNFQQLWDFLDYTEYSVELPFPWLAIDQVTAVHGSPDNEGLRGDEGGPDGGRVFGVRVYLSLEP
jgi:hypothetical protein